MTKTFKINNLNHPQIKYKEYNENIIRDIEEKMKEMLIKYSSFDESIIKNLKEYKYLNDCLKTMKRLKQNQD